MSTPATTHIEIDEHGVAWIVSENTKVIEVALDKIAYGWSPEEIHFQHPHLSLAQIHSALAYYIRERSIRRSSDDGARSRSLRSRIKKESGERQVLY